MDNWQPIETAPKDGTRFLGFGDGDCEVVRWHADRRVIWELVNENTQKRRVVEDGYWESDIAPTHWMPLPAPPRKDIAE